MDDCDFRMSGVFTNFSTSGFMDFFPWKYGVSHSQYPHWVLSNSQSGAVLANQVFKVRSIHSRLCRLINMA